MLTEQEIRQFVGEVMIVGFDAHGVNYHAERMLTHHYVRNFILFSRNIESMSQVRQLCTEMQELAKSHNYNEPLIICTDQENGIVRRVAPDLPGLPGNMAVGATGNSEYAHQVGLMTAEHLLSVGINMNLAPSVDVNNNPENPVIGVRSYGEKPNAVAAMSCAMIQGLQSKGVIACAKHFPGHGDTSTDSHVSLPVISHDTQRLNEVELVPFRRAISEGVDVIMTAHVIFSSVDPTSSATLSKRVLTDFLRGELGYQGVVTTDCLEMNAISETIGIAEGAVQAFLAGADFIMVSHELERQESAIEALVKAVRTGRISEARIIESVERIRILRRKLNARTPLHPANNDDLLNRTARLQERIAKRAVTVVKNEHQLLPVNLADIKNICVVMDADAPHNSASDPVQPDSFLLSPLRGLLPHANISLHVSRSRLQSSNLDEALLRDNKSELSAVFGEADLILVGVYGTTNAQHVSVLSTLIDGNYPVVVIALQSPYDISFWPEAPTVLATYECTPWMAKAAVEAVFGAEASGRLPVMVNLLI